MAEAIRLKDHAGWKERSAKDRAKRDKEGQFRDRQFASLSPAEKDTLLELVAVRLGLVK